MNSAATTPVGAKPFAVANALDRRTRTLLRRVRNFDQVLTQWRPFFCDSDEVPRCAESAFGSRRTYDGRDGPETPESVLFERPAEGSLRASSVRERMPSSR